MTSQQDIKNLILKYQRYLQLLKEQQAAFGPSCPPHTIIAIEDTEAKIAELEAELGKNNGLDEAQSNLPRQTFFFGRKKELESIADALTPESRGWGVLIDGPGGIGKTALAIQAGHLASVTQFPRKIFLSAKRRELTSGGEQPLDDFMLTTYMSLLVELAREFHYRTLLIYPSQSKGNG